jgi:hypothetical protein
MKMTLNNGIVLDGTPEEFKTMMIGTTPTIKGVVVRERHKYKLSRRPQSSHGGFKHKQTVNRDKRYTVAEKEIIASHHSTPHRALAKLLGRSTQAIISYRRKHHPVEVLS